MRRSIIVLLGLVLGTLVVLAPTADAWETDIEATSGCSDEQATISVTFRNTETRVHGKYTMYVIAIDEQSGASIDLGAVPVGQEATGVIETGLAELLPGQVRFEFTWGATAEIEVATVLYDAVGPCTGDTTEVCHKVSEGVYIIVPVPTSLLDVHLGHGDFYPTNGVCIPVDPNGQTKVCHVENNAFTIILVDNDELETHLAAYPEDEVLAAGQENCRDVVQYEICHVDENGQTTGLITITEFEVPEHEFHGDYYPDSNGQCVPPRPTVDICHINDDGTVELITIIDLDEAEHLAHGDFPPDAQGTCEDVYGICHVDLDALTVELIWVPFGELADHLGHGDFLRDTVTGCDGNVELCHRGDDGSITQITVPSILVAGHLAHGDTPLNQAGNCGRLAEICHVDNGVPSKIEVPVAELATHFGHGDYLPLSTGECVDPEHRFAICHTEDGGMSFELIYIADSETALHLAHGDEIPTGAPPYRCDAFGGQPLIPKPAGVAPAGTSPVLDDTNPIVITIFGRVSQEELALITTPEDIDGPEAFQPLDGSAGTTATVLPADGNADQPAFAFPELPAEAAAVAAPVAPRGLGAIARVGAIAKSVVEPLRWFRPLG